MMMDNPALDETTEKIAYEVIGAAIEVHRTLGPGFLEAVYERALCVELSLRGMSFRQQHPVKIIYKGQDVGEGYVDILVDNRLVVELKTVEYLLPIHKAQALSYLKALNLPLALLINFKTPVLKKGIQRVILTQA